MGMESYLGKRLGNFNSSFYNDGIRGQCVWYVRGRAKEKAGVDTGIRGDAKTWYSQAKHKGKELRSDSIACFGGGSFGHVIYIELVENGWVYYTEANANADNTLSSDDGLLKRSTVSQFYARKGYQGCIYLMDYKSRKKGEAAASANLHYRKSPGGEIAGTLPRGSRVTFADDSRKKAGGYTWRKILVNGKVYYAAEEYLV
ncbi:CHAP domain-containing protein [Ruminococcus sp. Marseille-P6503]|uniref:CHAP domain-containing protein n=1 Tax=Ruminococcus sp. Marseille-P6503 TaxID=2364796 RepID=UPI000F535A0F|nr:CHAP domain-containing protein [Ruminococcus sp. Marseille-P6503]